jgi:predicted phage gp36 major capsid-like protein
LSDKLAEENRIRCVDQADKRALSNARAREINEMNEEISAEHARAARASAEAAVNTAQREEQAVADVVAKEKAERLRDEGFRKKAIEQSDELRSLRTTLSAVEANAQRDAQVCRYFPE